MRPMTHEEAGLHRELQKVQDRVAELEKSLEVARNHAHKIAEERDALQGKADLLDRLWNEIDCRIDHGAHSNGHLEGLREIILRAWSAVANSSRTL